MGIQRFFTGLALLSLLTFTACGGGGSLAEGGRPAASSGNQQQLANINLRVGVTRPQGIRAQLANLGTLEIRIIDSETFLDVVQPVILDPNEPVPATITIQNVPVGLRILRIQGFNDPPNIDPVSGLRIPDPNYAEDFLMLIDRSVSNEATITIDNTGITGTVNNAPPIGQAGTVETLNPNAGPTDNDLDPDVDMVGLQGVITFLRGGTGPNTGVIAQVFRTVSTDITQPLTDVDQTPDGIVVNGSPSAETPQVAMDQLNNFTVAWLDNGTTPTVINAHSFTGATPTAPDGGLQADVTVATVNGDVTNFALNSTTNPTPPPGTGFGGEVRHLLFTETIGSPLPAAFLNLKTGTSTGLNCDTGVDPAPCSLAADILTAAFGTTPALDPSGASPIGHDVGVDGFYDITAFEAGGQLWASITRASVPLVGVQPIQLTTTPIAPGTFNGIDVAAISFNFAQATDKYVVVYQLGSEIFGRTCEFTGGVNSLVSAPVKIGDGSQPRVASANNDQFYVVWTTPNNEIALDLFNHADMSRVSMNPVHIVSINNVEPMSSESPRIATSSFGAIVVWRASLPSTTSSTIFERRYGAGFQP